MAKKFGKTAPTAHSAENGGHHHSASGQVDVDADKYRILCAHVHTLALALSMVACCFHILLVYEDFKMGVYYRLIRHIPCAMLFGLVVVGNRLYKSSLYLFYLALDFLAVIFIIVMESMRQYRIRTDPELKMNVRHSIYFFIVIWAIMFTIEACIYYVIYRDYRFVRDVESNPPAKVMSIRHPDRIGAHA